MIPEYGVVSGHIRKEGRSQEHRMNKWTQNTRRKIPFSTDTKKKQKHNTLTKQGAKDWEKRGERDVRGSKSANKNEELYFGPSSKSRTRLILSVFGSDETQ